MRKVFQLNLKNLEQEDRTFSGYGSTFGNVDRVGDVVEKGAFAKSLDSHKSSGTMPAMLLHHDMHRPIGVWNKMEEDELGLSVEGKLTQGVRDADEAYALLKDGALHSMSIGYRVVREEYDRKSGVNHLHEISLHELSLVTIPANAAAVVGGVKDEEGIPNIRELERVLREAGLSRREAKAFLAEGFKALRSEEPAELVEETVCPDVAAKAVEDELRRQAAIADMLKHLGR